jgi:hypothetical protein
MIMKNSSSLRLALTASVALLLPLGACTRTEPAPAPPAVAESDLRVTDAPSTPAPKVASDHTHPSEVTWQTFDTFPEVVAASDLVVHGRVVAQRPAVMRLYPYNQAAGRMMTPAEAGNEFDEVPLTISTLAITEVVRGKPGAVAKGGATVTVGSQIEIAEMGGVLPDGCLSQPKDKPLLGRADEGVYFLSTASRPGAYHVVGGWQGRMTVRQGGISPLASDVHPNATELTRFAGKPVKDFVAEVRAMALN